MIEGQGSDEEQGAGAASRGRASGCAESMSELVQRKWMASPCFVTWMLPGHGEGTALEAPLASCSNGLRTGA